MERTFAIIKPDAIGRRYAGRILQRIEEAGFQIRAMRACSLTQREAEGFYAVHRERPFFNSLTEFMSSGPVVVMVLEAPDAIKKWRTLMGATDPGQGRRRHAPEGIRAVDRATTPRTAPTRRRRRPSRSATSSPGVELV